MAKLTQDERGRTAEKVMEWGNLVFAGLVVTQFLAPSFNILAAVLGFSGIVAAYVVAVAVMKGGGRG